jgi:hypothetical protein
MISSRVKELNEARAKVAQLEEALAAELASLPAAYGFESLEIFVAAVEGVAGKKRVGRPRKSAVPKARTRARITDAVRARVKKLVEAGKTGTSIAKALGISLPSVQNVKKALGLVKTRKKPAPKPKVRSSPSKVKASLAPKAKTRRPSPSKASASAPKPAPVAAEPAPASTS